MISHILPKHNTLLECVQHPYKYRLFFGKRDHNYIRYDNERGKGDHCHLGDREVPYRFVSIPKLLDDFRQAVEEWEEA